MITYTHMCMNCGPELNNGPAGLAGAATCLNERGRCARCDSEAVVVIDASTTIVQSDDAARLSALEVFHEEIVREKNILIIVLRSRERDILAALAAYRAGHPKCAGAKRCRRCRRADEFLSSIS